MNAPRVTERTMLDHLAARHADRPGKVPEWLFAEQVRDAAGFDASRTADAIAMHLWPSRRHEVHGFEVKTSRSDWLREIKDPGKAERMRRYCHRWWLVVPDAALVKDGEMPPGWGMLALDARGVLRVVVAASRAEMRPWDVSFTVAFTRSVATTAAGAGRSRGWRERQRAERAEAERATTSCWPAADAVSA